MLRMSKAITANFRATSWQETDLAPAEGLARMTRASCTQRYEGDIVGQSVLEYLMAYADGGNATFVGIERIEGAVLGRQGSFVLRHVGRFEGGIASMQLETVGGAGTGALADLRASGSFESPHKESYTVTLTVESGADA